MPSLEALIKTLLSPGVFPDLEIEPVADDSDSLTTFTFSPPRAGLIGCSKRVHWRYIFTAQPKRWHLTWHIRKI